MSELLETRKPARHLPRIRVPQAVLLDWDRTLGKVDASLKRLYAVADRHGIDTQKVRGEYRQAKKDGGSYEPLTVIKQKLEVLQKPVPFGQLRQEFRDFPVEKPEDRLVYDDSAGLLRRVESSKAPYMVPTFGINEEWQHDFKIAGGGYGGHTEVLSHSNKGPYTESLRGPDGTFDFHAIQNDKIVAVVEAESVALVDDKVPSLEGMPDDCTGYLLRRPDEETLASQAGDWPAELTVASLGQLTMQNGVLVRLDQPLANGSTALPQPQTLYVPVSY